MKAFTIGRRALLRISAAGIVSSTFAACTRLSQSSGAVSGRSAPPALDASQSKDTVETDSSKSRVLLVFFSRAGENYFNGGRKNLAVGNTEVAAGMIRDALGCDVYQIQPSTPYSESYDDTVRRNVQEQNDNARPEIINALPSIDDYDVILIGSPVWNVRVPRIMLTFIERFDFAGKVVYPFNTNAVSGLGNIVEEYTAGCRGATIGAALAVRGEEVETSRPLIEEWLRKIGQLS
jgi:flavodoxin